MLPINISGIPHLPFKFLFLPAFNTNTLKKISCFLDVRECSNPRPCFPQANHEVAQDCIKNIWNSWFYIKEYETMCVKVKVKQNWPRLDFTRKGAVKQDSQFLLKCSNRLHCLTDPCQCVSKRLYVLSASGKKLFWLFRWLKSSVCLPLFLNNGTRVNSGHIFFPPSSASTRHLHSITMERNEKRREDRLHVWTRCVHPILLVKISWWIPDLLANLRISNATHLTTCLALFSSLALPGSSSLSFSQTYPKSFGSSDHCSWREKKQCIFSFRGTFCTIKTW